MAICFFYDKMDKYKTFQEDVGEDNTKFIANIVDLKNHYIKRSNEKRSLKLTQIELKFNYPMFLRLYTLVNRNIPENLTPIHFDENDINEDGSQKFLNIIANTSDESLIKGNISEYIFAAYKSIRLEDSKYSYGKKNLEVYELDFIKECQALLDNVSM